MLPCKKGGLTWLSCSNHQAELLCGLPVTDMATAGKAVEALATKGVGSVVLTMGEQGVLFTEPRAKPASIQHVATEKVSVVDTTVRMLHHLLLGRVGKPADCLVFSCRELVMLLLELLPTTLLAIRTCSPSLR